MTIYPPSVSAALHYQENHATGDLLCSRYRSGRRHALLTYLFFMWRSQTKTIIYIPVLSTLKYTYRSTAVYTSKYTSTAAEERHEASQRFVTFL